MSRSGGARARWFSRRGARARTGPAADPAPSAPVTTLDRSERPGGGGRGRGGALLVEEYGGVMLLRSPADDTLSTSDVADLARALSVDPEHTVTVVAGADASSAGELWPRLGRVLDSLRSDGVGVVRLVLAAAGDDRPDEPAVARRIADAWEIEVIAPDGVAVVVPGGSLFVPERRSGRGVARGGGERGGWWRFAPGVEPVRIGSRQPAPAWQPAVEYLPVGTSGGYAVEQIPAGVLVRSRDAIPPRPDDLCYAVPADPRGPTVLLGAPHDEDIPAGDLTELLTALPEAVRPRVRLAPGGPRDILRTSQSVADSLGVELLVRTGMPLMSYGIPTEPGTVRSVLVGADGAPRWQPFVDTVVCAPAREGETAPSPRLSRWSPPVPGRGSAEHGAIRLSEQWRVTVTRAGLWITDTESEPPPATARAVDPEGPAIELGHPGRPIDATLYPVLGKLLGGLGADVCGRARLFVLGTCADGGRELRRIAAEHGLRTLRFGAGLAPARPEVRRPAPAESAEAPTEPGPAPVASAPAAEAEPEPDHERDPMSLGTLPEATPQEARLPEATPLETTEDPRPVFPPTRPSMVSTASAPVAAPAAHDTSAAPGEPAVSATSGAGAGPGPESSRPRTGGPGPSRPPGSGRVRDPERPEPPGADRPLRTGSGTPPPPMEPDQRSQSLPPMGLDAMLDLLRSQSPPDGAGDGDSAPSVSPLTRRPTQQGAPLSRPSQGQAPQATPNTPATPATRTPPASPESSEPPALAEPPAAPVSPAAPLSTTGSQSTQAPPPTTAPEPTTPVTPATPEPPAPEPPAAPLRPLPPVPFLPGHVSTEAERTAFRALADAVWERHSAAVTRALTRMPALRGPEQEAARIDLIALHMYLDTSYDLDTPDAPDTPAAGLSQDALARGMRTGDERLLPYAACVASALRRLPSYRGLACRRTHEADGGLVPGTLLRDPAPVCALPPGAGAPRPAGAQYAIWSVTGRRTRQLTGRPGSASGGDEVVFAPGTLLRVLDVRDTAGAPLVLLREVPTTASSPSAAGAVPQDTRLDDHDRAALDRLDEALRRHRPAATHG
ncbi:hypothetical protein SBI_00563 [Streptomyces bingchenggensis BCW-1]|uniref:Uncharacterized protein n=1 Tax=Streptomyces bingchenggensis (strain BCW-1) TaxID=749414 RepID=D7C0J3_STRBB|nr:MULTISPECIES: hypothetical protein [Streptomyces]ADI03684.1 hypothetical protein SBI_00563 [Streptomyces bingchenggensis BCW-1]